MKYASSQLVLSLGASAIVAREPGQCVQLRASGGVSGILRQIGDGQNSIGGDNPFGCYCLSNVGFTDSSGRGCILTAPTTQLQCDIGASRTTGFSIGSSGMVTYNGGSTFYACPVKPDGPYNVYSKPVAGQPNCVKITLGSAGSCYSGGQPSNSPPVSSETKPSSGPSCETTSEQPSFRSMTTSVKPLSPSIKTSASPPSLPQQTGTAPTPPQSSGKANNCPVDLNGNYQYPHLIVPVNSEHPSQAYGTNYFGMVSSTTCSIFNFDIPSSYSGRTCTLLFLWPKQS